MCGDGRRGTALRGPRPRRDHWARARLFDCESGRHLVMCSRLRRAALARRRCRWHSARPRPALHLTVAVGTSKMRASHAARSQPRRSVDEHGEHGDAWDATTLDGGGGDSRDSPEINEILAFSAFGKSHTANPILLSAINALCRAFLHFARADYHSFTPFAPTTLELRRRASLSIQAAPSSRHLARDLQAGFPSFERRTSPCTSTATSPVQANLPARSGRTPFAPTSPPAAAAALAPALASSCARR